MESDNNHVTFLAVRDCHVYVGEDSLGLTSMIVCVGLVVTGVLEWQTAFAGFIDINVMPFCSNVYRRRGIV